MKIRFLLNVIDIFAKKQPDSLLLVRLDGIGDYILFRNFIEILKSNENYKKYKITLCGNILWKDLAETFDNKIIDKYFWIDKNKFNKSKLYRNYILLKIHMRKFDLLIQPTFSRIPFSERLVKEFNAEMKIGSISDLTNLTKENKYIYDEMYNILIPATSAPLFEFYRNKEFFENLFGYSIEIQKPRIDLSGVYFERLKNIKKKYVVFFPGAGYANNRWDTSKLSVVAEHLLSNYDYEIIIAGGKNDKYLAEDIIQKSRGVIHDFTGSLSLPELFILIKYSELLITNDTSAVHIGATLNNKCICISNGNYYGRFLPYPKEVTTNLHIIFHNEINDRINIDCLYETYKYGSSLNINSIEADQVINEVDHVLRQ